MVTALSLFQMWLLKFELNVFGDFLQRESLGRLPALVISHVLLLRGGRPTGASEPPHIGFQKKRKKRKSPKHQNKIILKDKLKI